MGSQEASKLVFDKPGVRVRSGDGLMNVYSGMGTGNASSSHNKWSPTHWMNGHVIDVIYRESWLAQAICAIPAEDATREWRRFTGDHAEDIARVEKALNLQSLVAEAKTFSRAYGGAGILMVTNQPLDQPLDLNKVKKGDLKKLLVLDRYDLSAPLMNLTRPLDDNWMLPEYYTLVDGSQRIHHSHLVRLEGLRLPRRLAAIEHGWGDSELRRILQDINMVVASFMGIGELMQEANVDVITSDSLAADLSTEQEAEIIERYRLFNLMKSNYNLSLLDASEKLDRLTLSLTGVAPVQEQLLTWISGCARIPVTRLFGTSAKGMSATGEGDEDVYNDRCRSMQSRDLSPALKQLDQVMVRSAVGEYPADTDFRWNPLSQLDDEEQGNLDYTDSQTDKTYFDMGIIRRSHIAMKLQSKATYDITDEEIEALKAMEEEAPEPDDDFELDLSGGGSEGDQ